MRAQRHAQRRQANSPEIVTVLVRQGNQCGKRLTAAGGLKIRDAFVRESRAVVKPGRPQVAPGQANPAYFRKRAAIVAYRAQRVRGELRILALASGFGGHDT